MLRPAGLRSPELVLASALAAAAALTATRPAAAEDNLAKADALFAEGVKLRDSNAELACAKFGESLQLNPQAIGVLLNVAMCDERRGRIASAVRRYRETRERAVELHFPEYQKAADGKLAALEPEVPLLTVRFEKAPAPQTKVVIDDQVVSPSALAEIPLDPGERVVIVSAPGRITFQQKLSIARREHRELVVPALDKPTQRRTIGKLTAAGGGAAVAASVVLGLVANSRYDHYRHLKDPSGGDACQTMDNKLLCTSAARDGINSARLLGNVGTIVGAAGVAAVLVGGYLWYFAPKPHSGEHSGSGGGGVSVVPTVAPDGGGLSIIGRF